jgi:hypothetical protein
MRTSARQQQVRQPAQQQLPDHAMAQDLGGMQPCSTHHTTRHAISKACSSKANPPLHLAHHMDTITAQPWGTSGWKQLNVPECSLLAVTTADAGHIVVRQDARLTVRRSPAMTARAASTTLSLTCHQIAHHLDTHQYRATQQVDLMVMQQAAKAVMRHCFVILTQQGTPAAALTTSPHPAHQ